MSKRLLLSAIFGGLAGGAFLATAQIDTIKEVAKGVWFREGDIMGDEIVCPWHLWGFDVRTGVCMGNPEMSIVVHEVKVHHDRIFVKLAPARPGMESSTELL